MTDASSNSLMLPLMLATVPSVGLLPNCGIASVLSSSGSLGIGGGGPAGVGEGMLAGIGGGGPACRAGTLDASASCLICAWTSSSSASMADACE